MLSAPTLADEHLGRLQDEVRRASRIRPSGGRSKSALSAAATLELSGVAGVLEYVPQEYTFTALAGTTLQTVNELLAGEGQYLPFDPPLAQRGATLGGTVAAGLSGAGRLRYGGVRDFLLGVRFVSGAGEIVTGGGRVVKNAAGFDFPKLMVGALGQFGPLVELTFKVFPRPESTATLLTDLPSLSEASAAMARLATSGLEPTCLDLDPPGRLILRLAGLAEALPKRLERVQAFLGQEGEVVTEDDRLWAGAGEFKWLPPGHGLVKVPLNPSCLAKVEGVLSGLEPAPPRRYSVGGNVLWLGWPDGEEGALEGALSRLERPALALLGPWDKPLFGPQPGGAFLHRVRRVLDPDNKCSAGLGEPRAA